MWWPASALSDGALATVAAAFAERGADHDIWVGCGLRAQTSSNGGRGGDRDIAGIPGMWADIDERPTDVVVALKALECPPSQLVGSGHGVHAWWLFDEFWTFANDGERVEARTLLRRLHVFLRDQGWKVDAVHDLARVMRVPGTMNHKQSPPMPVTLYGTWQPRRYAFSELDDWLPPGKPAPLPGDHAPPPTSDVGDDTIDSLASGYAANDERFAKTWARQRSEFGSASKYDLAVCVKAADMGADDATCWALVRRWRQLHGEDPAKAERSDYATRTLAKARVGEPPQTRDGSATPNGADLWLPDSFWTERGTLRRVRTAARARLLAPDAVLHSVLARVAADVPHTISLPAIVGTVSPLCYFCALVGAPGAGKSGAPDVARELVPFAEGALDGLPLGSGEGFAEILFERVTKVSADGKEFDVKEQTRHNAFWYIDEGQVLAELGARSGQTILGALRSAWSGATLGNTNASPERRRIVPAGSYTFGVTISFQPVKAARLLADGAGGTPQRFVWVAATDPAAPDVLPDWPGRLTWRRPPTGDLEVRRLVKVDPGVITEIVAARQRVLRGQEERGELDEHRDLLRLRVAALLALLECLEFALSRPVDSDHGVWGGTNHLQRHVARRRGLDAATMIAEVQAADGG